MYPDNLRIALVQCSIVDLEAERNLEYVEQEVIRLSQEADLIVFPEAISTGFSADAIEHAEEWGAGVFYKRLSTLASSHGVAIAGSMFVLTSEGRANRFFLISSDGVQWQDKRHLFALGGEPDKLYPARERKVLTYRGWRILPLVCYDLRFPVWSRCVANEYDLILCVANWPKGRRAVWSSLLVARAMENLAYVVGVNRVGQDASGLEYTGDSVLINPRGQILVSCAEASEQSVVHEISYAPLAELREKFPVWQDADVFVIELNR